MGLFRSLFNLNKVSTNDDLVKLVIPNAAPDRYISKALFTKALYMAVDNKMKILKDSVKLVNSTEKPKIFFTRRALILETLEFLAKLEPVYPFKGSLPSKDLINIQSKKVAAINDFIKRYFDSVRIDMATLKTAKAKQRKMDLFCENMLAYDDEMEDENRKNYKALYTYYTQADKEYPTT